MDWIHYPTVTEAIDALRADGFTICCLEQVKGSVALDKFRPDPNGKYAVIVGHEVDGVSQEAVDAADICLEIPQYGTKHSLNVSVSAALALSADIHRPQARIIIRFSSTMPKPQPHITNLSEVAMPAIIAAFAEAFSDYAVTFDPAQTEAMSHATGPLPGAVVCRMGRWPDSGFHPHRHRHLPLHSHLLRLRHRHHPLTARTRTRGRSVPPCPAPPCRQRCRQYLLEVLTTNERAIALYTGAGFSRDTLYLCYGGDTALSLPHGVCPPAGISLRPIDPGVLHGCATFTDFTPSWQNSFESIERGAGNLVMTGAFDNCQGRCVGYCVADPATGDISG